jgi:RecD/TraA family predicted helicase
MPRLDIGVEYISTVEKEESPKYGISYNVISIYQDVPETQEGQRDFLKTLLTDLQVQAVYDAYGDVDVIELIKDNTFDYKKVKGFGSSTYERVRERVLEALEYKEMLSKFGKFGITYETIVKLTEEFGSKELAIQKLEADPYCLTVLDRWGFKRADVVARKMGFVNDHPFRVRSGIKYALEENQQNGHTFMHREDLLGLACDILDSSESVINEQIDQTEGLKIIDDKIALQKTYNAEYFIAKRLKEMIRDNTELDFDPDEFIGRMEKKYGMKLTHQQKDFFHMVKKNRVGLLVGFAGVGKSQMQKFIVDLLDELKLRYTFLSPSAKAAKVTTNYTGIKAKTIHKAIGWGKGKTQKQLIEIDEDFIIVDEVGMMDVFIGSSLLAKIVNPKARILFAGDPFQLSSIQAGNFLHDAIESGVVPVTKLDIVFRQQEGGLLHVVTEIRKGNQIVPDSFSGKKVFGKDFILHCINQAEMSAAYRYYYRALLKSHKPEDIVVISPTRKEEIGTVEINKYIQSEVNPEDESKLEYAFGDECMFRIGDYVINTVNMYDTLDYDDKGIDIVNGDSGIIVDIVRDKENKNNKDDDDNHEKERDKNGIVIQFDSGLVRLDFNRASQLLHSWSVTGHRMQGSAADATISIADKANTFMLSANFIYTMLTRARQKGILLTQAETLNRAVRKFDNMRRNTHMQSLLQGVNDN